MDVKFSETTAYSNRDIHEKNANINWFESASVLDAIMRDEFSGYGVDGLRSLGFTNIEK